MQRHFFYLVLLFICTSFALPAQVRGPLKRGVVKGVVTDKLTQRPIAGALVLIANDTLRTLTSSEGLFQIEEVPLGYKSLYVSCEEYHALVTQSFLVTAAAAVVVDVELEESLVELAEVVVSASMLVSTGESPVSMRRIGAEEIEMTPGANRDISKVVQSAPGVVATSMQRNDILVRGGGANENKYYMDGIEIPVLNHFAVQGGSGGNASLVNTDFLRTVNFHTGAFPANFGNGLSSVMDMRLKDGNADRFKGKLTVGASDVGLSVDTPISKGGKTTFLGSYRRSYLQMLFQVLGLPFLPTYNDYQFKITTKIDANNELYFIGLGSFDNNRLNRTLEEPEPDRQYILGYLPENRQSSYVVGAGYRHSFQGGQLRLYVSRDNFSNLLYKYRDNDAALPKILNYDTHQGNTRLRGELERWYGSGFRLSAGMGVGTGDYRNTTFRSLLMDDQVREENYRSRVDLLRYEAYATLGRRFFEERLSVLVGLRMDGMNYTPTTSNPLQQLSPRLSLSYTFSPVWSVSGSVSRYYQEPSYTSLGYRDANNVAVNKENGLRYVRADHFVLGVEATPGRNSRISVEGFLKQYDRFPVSLVDSLPLSTSDFADYTLGDVPVRSVGVGRAYGAELSYRNLDLHNTVLNVSYTFLYSEFRRMDAQLQPTGGYRPSSWDARHILNLSVIHKFERNWVLGGKWYYVGGLPFTPYNEALSSQITAWDARLRPYRDYARYNLDRESPYHQLDLRLDKMWYFQKWRVGFYVDIQNVYNFKALGQEILMPVTDASGAYVPDPNRPGHYQMQHVENTVGGTILPTLGLVVEW